MTDKALKSLLKRLKEPRPWNEENFRAVSLDGLGSALRYRMRSNVIAGEIEFNSFLQEVGTSNLLTLTIRGAKLKDFSVEKRQYYIGETTSTSWRIFDGAYLWETAAVATADQLAELLEKHIPLGGMWRDAASSLKG